MNRCHVQICPSGQQAQEELIPSKALEAEVGVASADFKSISFTSVSGAEKIWLALSVFPQAPYAHHICLSRLSPSLAETI